MSLEQQRNEWVAATLGVAKVYRDDNIFIDEADPEGLGTACIIDAGSQQFLKRFGDNHRFEVPAHLFLSFA